MPDFQQRVIDEKTALDEKIQKLEAFTNSPKLASVDEHEQLRLMRQLFAMHEYSTILGERIYHFKP